MAFRRRPQRPSETPLTTDEALTKLEQFCSFRERTPKEVRERMKELGVKGDEAEQLFTVLQEEKFFDEARFAWAYAQGKFRSNHWGRVRIRQELRMRDIDAAIIQEALDSIVPEEYESLLQQMIERKHRELKERGDDNARQKTAATLIRAGFEPDLVFRYL